MREKYTEVVQKYCLFYFPFKIPFLKVLEVFRYKKVGAQRVSFFYLVVSGIWEMYPCIEATGSCVLPQPPGVLVVLASTVLGSLIVITR